jgi:hypothetical protein
MPENQNGGSVFWSWAERVWVSNNNIIINPKGFKNLWGFVKQSIFFTDDSIVMNFNQV